MEKICTQAAMYVHMMTEELGNSHGIEEFTLDYARLFVGPYELYAAPYGSVYLEAKRRVMGESTIDVQNLYREAGMDVSKDFHEAPDHIVAELEFMHFLIFKEIQALTNSKVEVGIEYLKKQESFLKVHLGTWVTDFANSIEENARTQFYKYLGKCAKTFVNHDLKILRTFANRVTRLYGT